MIENESPEREGHEESSPLTAPASILTCASLMLSSAIATVVLWPSDLLAAVATTGMAAAALVGWQRPRPAPVGRDGVLATQSASAWFWLLALLCFQPMRRLVSRGTPTWPRDRHRILDDLTVSLASAINLERVLDALGRVLHDNLRLRSVSILLWSNAGVETYHYADGRSTSLLLGARANDALRDAVECRPHRVLRLRPEGETVAGGERSVRHGMQTLDAELVVPMIIGNRVVGALAVGRQRRVHPIDGHMEQLLNQIARQGAVAVNAILAHRELERTITSFEQMLRARALELASAQADLKRAHHQLRELHARAFQNEKMAALGELVAGIAHEINNPVSFIVGNIAPMQETLATLRECAEQQADDCLVKLADRLAESFDIIARGAERTARIVGDLRVFSRGGGMAAQPMDIHEGLEVTMRLLQTRCRHRVTIHREYGAVPLVEVASGPMNQVFMNLLANAFDAVGDVGNIWIRTAACGGTVTVTIEDDGGGITKDAQKRLFEPFFTTKAGEKGTGLGLTISREVVARHGGRIEVGDRPGGGARFTVVLPRDQLHEDRSPEAVAS